MLIYRLWRTVQQLKHVQHGLSLGVMLMTGVPLERTDTAYPSATVALCFTIQVFIYRKFEDAFKWEDLEHNISRFGRSPIAPVQVLGHAYPLDACPNVVAFRVAAGLGFGEHLLFAEKRLRRKKCATTCYHCCC